MEKIVATYSILNQKNRVHSGQPNHKQGRQSAQINSTKAACTVPKYPGVENMHTSSLRSHAGNSKLSSRLVQSSATSAESEDDDAGDGNETIFDFQSEINGGATIMSTLSNLHF